VVELPPARPLHRVAAIWLAVSAGLALSLLGPPWLLGASTLAMAATLLGPVVVVALAVVMAWRLRRAGAVGVRIAQDRVIIAGQSYAVHELPEVTFGLQGGSDRADGVRRNGTLYVGDRRWPVRLSRVEVQWLAKVINDRRREARPEDRAAARQAVAALRPKDRA